MLGDDAANQSRARSRARVEKWVEQGLLTKDLVNERFTELVVEESYIDGLSAYKSNHDCLSRHEFSQLVTVAFDEEPPNIQSSAAILYDIALWHAAFPFPPDESSTLSIASLAKSIAVLDGPNIMQVNSFVGIFRTRSGKCTVERERQDQDRRRLLFRSVARPTTEAVDNRNLETLPVVESIYYDHDPSLHALSPEWHQSRTEKKIVDHEDERSIDVLDLLTRAYPNPQPMVASPLRSSFRIAVESLPHYSTYLHHLVLDPETYRSLVTLNHWLQAKTGRGQDSDYLQNLSEMSDHIQITSNVIPGGGISWTTFDGMVERHLPHIFDRLLDVFWTILIRAHLVFPSPKAASADFEQSHIINTLMYTQICSFLPIEDMRLLFCKNGAFDLQEFAQKVAGSDSPSILLVQGRSITDLRPSEHAGVVLGAYIPGQWTTDASFPSTGLKCLSDAPSAQSKRTVIFQLSPVPRIYRDRRNWNESSGEEAMIQDGGITFQRSLAQAFEPTDTPRGSSYLALDKMIEQAVFAVQTDWGRFLPYNASTEGEIKIQVDKMEVWAVGEEQGHTMII
ncbi:MAG: hypothetical protein M1820_004268 [Bogoriella megaspora]|nr:MAG: hypothetical protein M1820_004268 [Bogoriella megaspora]